jgi:hypothetical protein
VTPTPLSSAQWQAVKACYRDMPDEARKPIEDRVMICAHSIRERITLKPAATRDELMQLHDAARQLADKMAAISDDARNTLVSPSSPSANTLALLAQQEKAATLVRWIQPAPKGIDVQPIDREALEQFESQKSVTLAPPRRGELALSLVELQRQVALFADHAKAKAENIERGKSGADAESLAWLVQQLDYILQHYRIGQVNRSYKDDACKQFVTLLANAAAKAAGEPPYRSGSIDEAMKAVIRRRGEISPDKRG